MPTARVVKQISVVQLCNRLDSKMTATPVKQSLLSELQEHLSADLFASATLVRLAADEVLFLAGDAGNGCYRVEDGLIKVTMMSRAGVERTLAFLGPGAIVGRTSYYRWPAAVGIGGSGARG
jgi:CRP-like cAMP-binding protein